MLNWSTTSLNFLAKETLKANLRGKVVLLHNCSLECCAVHSAQHVAVVVHATCSLERQDNREVVIWFLCFTYLL